MKGFSRFYLFLLLVALSAGCHYTPSAMDRNALTEYIRHESHGLCRRYSDKGHTVTITYRPSDLHAYTDLKTALPQDRDSVRNYYRAFTYIAVAISGPVLYSDRLTDMKGLFYSDKTVAVRLNGAGPIGVYMEDYFTFNHHFTIVCVFPKVAGDIDFSIDLNAFGLSDYKFMTDKKTRETIPRLIVK